jgi:two-component system, cell cycle sensor histidine kinase and response regulator CckA
MIHHRAAKPTGLCEDASLSESEFTLRLTQFAIDNSPEAAFWIRKDANFYYVNDAACRSLGYSRAELLQMSVHDISCRDTRENWEGFWDKIRQAGRLLHESMHRRKDGGFFPVEISINYLVCDGIEFVCAVARDISERKLVEEALRKSGELFRNFFEMGLVGMAIVSPGGDWLQTNQKLCEMLGYERVEMMRHSWADLCHPADLEPALEGYRRLVAGEIQNYFAEQRFRHRDGRYVLVELWLRGVRQADGSLAYAIAEMRDITESRKAEQELRMLAYALRSIRETVVITDMEDRILLVNEAFCKTYGYSEGELIGQHISMIRSPRADAEMLASVAPATFQGGWQGELWNRKKNGTDFPVFLSTAVVHDDAGRPVALLGVASDISERRRVEAERQQLQTQLLHAQKLDAVGRLAGGIAHDFNNILTVIQGHCELLLEDLEPANPVRSEIAEIRLAGKRAAALTHQLLAFSRKQAMQPTVMDLNEVVLEFEKMLVRVLGESIVLTTRFAADECLVKADTGQMNQVLLNLAINARDAMPSGGKLAIETSFTDIDAATARRQGDLSGPCVVLSVTDTGFGMDEHVLQHIFEPFFTTKQPGQGTGLGLAMVFGIIKQSGGHIDVTSVPGSGTSFQIYLPRAVREEFAEGIPHSENRFNATAEPPCFQR